MEKTKKQDPRTCLVIPGFWEQKNERPYRELKKAIESRGYIVTFVDVQWKRRTVEHWQQDVAQAINTLGRLPDVIFGFSFGAYLAAITASTLPISRIVLGSLSPYFSEDLVQLPPIATRVLGIRRMEAFKKISSKKVLPAIHGKVSIFVGEKDFPLLLERAKHYTEQIKGARLTVLPRLKHELTPEYIQAIVRTL